MTKRDSIKKGQQMTIATQDGKTLELVFHGGGRIAAYIYECFDLGNINPKTNKAPFIGYVADYRGILNEVPCKSALLAETRARSLYLGSQKAFGA